MGTAVQEMQDTYSSTTGLQNAQQTLNSLGQVTAQVQLGYDDFGELSSYTDGAGNATAYHYNLAGHVSSRNDGKGTATFSFDTNGLPISESDTQAGTITATYNPDGSIASETYPGGLTASYGYDETGAATSVSYAGEAWTSPLSQSMTPDTHGNFATQTITDSSRSVSDTQAYTYDKANRLSTVQDTLSGQCITRTYGYNADSNRTSLATAAPGTGGVCQTANPVTVTSSYDSADRITDTGYTYDTQGDITTTPSAGAGGNGNLTATYYANNMLASQTQNGQTDTWQLDPTEQRFGSYAAGGITYTEHFSGPGSNPAWISGSDGSWTRSLAGPNGMLAATINAAGVTLQLVNLHGDIMATASTSASATGPAATYIYNEFGAAEQGSPGMYGWLGGFQISAAALGNDLLMGVRAYSSPTGRFDQVDPVAGGSSNAYDYARQNPIANLDLSGSRSYIRWYWYGFTLYLSEWATSRVERALAAGCGAAWLAAEITSWTGIGGLTGGAIAALLALGEGGLWLCDWNDAGVGLHFLYFPPGMWCWPRP